MLLLDRAGRIRIWHRACTFRGCCKERCWSPDTRLSSPRRAIRRDKYTFHLPRRFRVLNTGVRHYPRTQFRKSCRESLQSNRISRRCLRPASKFLCSRTPFRTASGIPLCSFCLHEAAWCEDKANTIVPCRALGLSKSMLATPQRSAILLLAMIPRRRQPVRKRVGDLVSHLANQSHTRTLTRRTNTRRGHCKGSNDRAGIPCRTLARKT